MLVCTYHIACRGASLQQLRMYDQLVLAMTVVDAYLQ
jgi:hypothetical protein